LGKLRYQWTNLDLVFPDDGVNPPPLSLSETLALEYDLLGLSAHGTSWNCTVRGWWSRVSCTVLTSSAAGQAMESG